MVRRTKQEALATRSSILDAAELVFHERGVSRTSLNDIAQAAGVTRGAIYWHFKDKGDLFNAMMERACEPFDDLGERYDASTSPRPIESLRDKLVEVLRRFVADPALQRTVEIATHKVEYIDELVVARQRLLEMRTAYQANGEIALRRAQQLGQVERGISPRAFGIGLHALIDGLLQNWLLDPSAFDLVKVGRSTIDLYMAGLPMTPVATGAASAANSR